MERHRKPSKYKFTGRSRSVKGIIGLSLAVLSLVLGIVMIVASARNRGAGSVYLGSAGVLSMLLALLGLVLAAISLKEKMSFKAFPVAAMCCSVLALGGWLALYVVGFLM